MKKTILCSLGAPYRATKTHYRITRAPCRGHETPCKAIRASIGPQESGHKDPLAGYNGPITMERLCGGTFISWCYHG